LRIACAVPLTDQVSQLPPPEPLREERRIRNAVEVAVDKVRLGEGVVLHCVGGTGRTGTVIGCLLRALGHTGPEVRGYLQAVHRARGKALRGGDWLESDWQRNLVTGFQL
jgi:protein-tyrosine phosphatase